MLKVTTHPLPSQTYLGCNADNLNCLGCVPGNYAQTDGGFQGSEYGGGGYSVQKWWPLKLAINLDSHGFQQICLRILRSTR